MGGIRPNTDAIRKRPTPATKVLKLIRGWRHAHQPMEQINQKRRHFLALRPNPRRQAYRRGKRHDVQDKNPIEPTIQTSSSRRVMPTGALFSLPQSKFFHSLSITLIFNHLHGVLNVGKKNN
jgi:hypothetical protein